MGWLVFIKVFSVIFWFFRNVKGIFVVFGVFRDLDVGIIDKLVV